MLNIIVPDNTEKIQKQIEALKHAIKTDQSEKDRAIHKITLSILEKVIHNNWDKDRINYEMIKEERILKVLTVFGKEVEDKIKNLKIYELNNVAEYGLMGLSIDEALEYKDTDPSTLREQIYKRIR